MNSRSVFTIISVLLILASVIGVLAAIFQRDESEAEF